MKRFLPAVTLVFSFAVVSVASDDANTFHAKLRGLNETPGPVSTQATGSFDATLSADGSTLTYTLTYSNLNDQVTQSHIHFGFPKETGGIMIWLCQTTISPAPTTDPGVPMCQDKISGTVTGTVTAANVVGPNSQGITPAADFAKVIQAIREHAAYVNVHSQRSPTGEIRGVVQVGDDDGDDR